MSAIAHAGVEEGLVPISSTSQRKKHQYEIRDHSTQDWELNMLVTQAAGGSQFAWMELWERIEPRLHAMVRKPRFLGGLDGCECSRRDVVLEVMSRLAADDCRRLHRYLEKRADCLDMRFLPWLHVVARRVAIDYLRAQDRTVSRVRYRRPGRRAAPLAVMIDIHSEPQAGEEPPMVEWLTARQMASYVDHALPTQQRLALKLWIQGESYSNIAEQLALGDAKHSERVVRAALQRLRRHFREID